VIVVWTDGSGTHDPNGPACIGVIIFLDGIPCMEASEHVGCGTNQFAELRAIRRGLWLARALLLQRLSRLDEPDEETSILVRTDSQYAIDMVFAQRYEPRAHEKLILDMRKQVAELESVVEVAAIHVDGHNGVFGNERADWLAGTARVRYFAAKGITKKPKREPWPPPAAPEGP
jgi:ribonuclease HI